MGLFKFVIMFFKKDEIVVYGCNFNLLSFGYVGV